jgi:hypothetical protein
MKIMAFCSAVLCLAVALLVAQTPAVPTMDPEPHHHLALHNDHVKVFSVEVKPGYKEARFIAIVSPRVP